MNQEVLSIPTHVAVRIKAKADTNISAIHLEPTINGAKLGIITQIPAGTNLDLCGDGYNDRTVKVRWRDQFYFVFLSDISLSKTQRFGN
jgi:hypothetical protein